MTWHVRADPDWQIAAPTDPESVMAANITDKFHSKQGRSIARWSLPDGPTVFIKRHYRESWWRRALASMTRMPRWSSAWQEYRNLRWAEAKKLPVPRTVAVGARIAPLAGFLAVEELTGQLALHELIPLALESLRPAAFATWKRGLVTEIARLARALHTRNRFHKDLYLCHFFAPTRFATTPPVTWTGRVSMIDLHRLGRHPLTAPWWRLKDLAQLLYSSDVRGVAARDRLRFWRLYAGPARRRGLGPWLRRLVLIRWQNYRDHNASRRAAA
jgi:Lipopolysaccharide kinase (Kdo/WaaP) family